MKSAPLGPEHGPRLTGSKVSIPLVLVHGYPFIEGAINGVRGKLLFDLGDPSSLTLDSHTVPLADGAVVGRGYFGSGQTFTRQQFPSVKSLSLAGGLSFANMENVFGQPGLPIEQHISPDFVGWIGIKFFTGYVLKLDYSSPSVTFFRNDPAGSGMTAAVAGERVKQSVRLGNLSHPNLLTVPLTVKGEGISAGLDTGSHTTAWLSDAQVESWKRAGVLHETPDKRFTISGLELDGVALPDMAVEVTRGAPPFRKLIPGEPEIFIGLGYEFFKLNKTVFDYDNGVLRLLAL